MTINPRPVGVFINDLHKGDRILMKSGQIAEIQDNRHGVTRMVKIENPNGSHDIGSEYAYKFGMVWRNEVWVNICMTPAQQAQCDKIKSFMG